MELRGPVLVYFQEDQTEAGCLEEATSMTFTIIQIGKRWVEREAKPLKPEIEKGRGKYIAKQFKCIQLREIVRGERKCLRGSSRRHTK